MPCNLATDYVAIRLGVEGDVLINTSVPWRVCECVYLVGGRLHMSVARGGSAIVTWTKQRMSTSGNYFTGIFYGGLFSVDAPLLPTAPGRGKWVVYIDKRLLTSSYWAGGRHFALVRGLRHNNRGKTFNIVHVPFFIVLKFRPSFTMKDMRESQNYFYSTSELV